MKTSETLSNIGDGIFSLSYKVKMSNLVNVLTYSRYLNEIMGIRTLREPSEPYGDLHNDEANALFINKSISIDHPSAYFSSSDKTAYVAIGDYTVLRYLNFYLNTLWGKYELSSGLTHANKFCNTNLSSIKKIEVILNKEIEPYCIYLQKIKMHLEDFMVDAELDDQMKSAIAGCFETIGNNMILELQVPNLFAQYKISLIEEWINLVDSVSSNNDIFFQIGLIIKAIFNIKSPIMDSLNRMKTFGPMIANTAIKNSITK